MTTEATTTTEIQSLIEDDSNLTCSFGLRVLDENDELIEDISDHFIGGKIEYRRESIVHRTARLQISQERTWSTERLQPYQTWTDGTYHKTWYMGVFIPSTPDVDYGRDPLTYEVECMDKMTLLDRPVGDDYTVAAAAVYITAVQNVITAAGVTGAGTLIDDTSLASTLAGDMCWYMGLNYPTTYLDICNDLLDAIGYEHLWVDENGYFRSEPKKLYSERPVVWRFDLSNTNTQIVLPARTFYTDEINKTTQYRFVRTNIDAEPTEGAGYVTLGVSPGYYALGGTVTYDGDYTIRTFTSSGTLEWSGAQVDDVQFLVQGGGGGGGYGQQNSGAGGGGGGGETLVGTTSLSAGDYTVTIGAGGAGGDAGNSEDGEDTVFGSITASGGGGGGTSADNPGVINIDGHDGGNAGGGGACASFNSDGGAGEQYDGGDGHVAGSGGAGGGGGGSSANGADGSGADLPSLAGGAGGAGTASSISGASVTYGGGGGGGVVSSAGGTAGAGGAGGGGAGGKGAVGTAGTANRGGGGGGGGRLSGISNSAGGAGGSGIVIVKYLTPDTKRIVIPMDTEDQTSLETNALDYIAKNVEKKKTITIKSRPWPLGGHNQVVEYVDDDADIDDLCTVVGWMLDIKGDPTEIELEIPS